jgi:hypothetical protein
MNHNLRQNGRTALLLLALTLGLSLHARAQTHASTPPPAQDATAAKVAQYLEQSGVNYKKVNANVWVVQRQGKNLANFQIILATDPNFLIAGVIIAKKNNMRMTPELMAKLLRLNHTFDYAKVGLDDDEDLFARYELHTGALSLQVFKDCLDDVASATDRLYPELKPFLIAP